MVGYDGMKIQHWYVDIEIFYESQTLGNCVHCIILSFFFQLNQNYESLELESHLKSRRITG